MKNVDFSKVLFLFAGALLFFVYGLAVSRFHIFPYSVLKFAEESLVEVFAERGMLTGTRPTAHLFKARHEGNGVTHFDKDQAFPGFTLLSGFFGDGLELRLIRLDGSIVNRWPARFHDLFRDTSHIQPEDRVPRTNWNTSLLGSMAFPDGSILFNLEAGGLVKLDRCGAVQWTLARMVHHSIDQAEDGGFWIPSIRYISRDSPFPLLTPPYKEETIMKVSPDGKILQEISVPRLLFDNKLAALLFANGKDGNAFDTPDLTHLNDVEELKSQVAGQFPLFSAGDLLVSLRNLNLVMVVDPKTQKVKWHQTGPWLDQHDPDFTANGKISVFSNNNNWTKTGSINGGSTVIEVDPVTRETSIRYGALPKQKFFTRYRGQHQLLDNGNLLISDSEGGRALEVNREGSLVWQMINRFDEDNVAIVNDVVRYPAGYFTVNDWTCPKRS